MQQDFALNRTFSERTDQLAARLRINVQDLPEIIGISRRTLFECRSAESAVSRKTRAKLEAAERVHGLSPPTDLSEESFTNPKEPSDADSARSIVRESPMCSRNSAKVELGTHLQMVNKALAEMHGGDEIIHADLVSDDVQIYGAKAEPTLAEAFALLRKAIDILESIATKQNL